MNSGAGIQFIEKGPSIPYNLIKAHEDERVVFFCGAGISHGAKLPLFDELVKKIADAYCLFNGEVKKYWRKGNYDLALHIIAHKIGKKKFIDELCKQLTIKTTIDYYKVPHNSILGLSRDRSGKTKLVTTNADRIFEEIPDSQRIVPKPEPLIAPRPPIPKNHYWDGLVYLHGLIPPGTDHGNEALKNNLIFTTGDFGRAYLSERWASRFVTEMFKNYVVCFIGYSANDPVMRYILDAMQSDEVDGETLPNRYIFTDNQTENWNLKGLIPVCYDNSNNHQLLLETINRWSEYYQDGLQKKETVLREIELRYPPVEDKNYGDKNNYNLLIWALRDPYILRLFVNQNPRPHWQWTEVLTSKQFDFEDFESFGLPKLSKDEQDHSGNYQKFSLIERIPNLGNLSRQTFKGTINPKPLHNDPIDSFNIWICRHLDNPEAALWLQRYYSVLSADLKWRINLELKKCSENDKEYCIPKVMCQLWQYFLNDQVGQLRNYTSINSHWYTWHDQYEKTKKLTTSLAVSLAQMLMPQLEIGARYRVKHKELGLKKIENCLFIADYFQTEIDIKIDGAGKELVDLALNCDPQSTDNFFHIFEKSLTTLFNFWQDVAGKDAAEFSIEHYVINLDFGSKQYHHRQWECLAIGLYELLKEWLSKTSSNSDQNKAKKIVRRWLDSPYYFFRYIAFKLISEDGE